MRIKSDATNHKPNRDESRKLKFQLLGWMLFVVCALFYLASSLKNRDFLAVAGSIAFLVACIVFLVPVMDVWKRRNKSRKGS
jgi:hypothetical protein